MTDKAFSGSDVKSGPFLLATSGLEVNHRTVRALEQKVADFIAAHDLFAHGQRVLLAVSGGADSVALLAIMEALNASKVLPVHPICLHINHKLRGAHSDDDERFVEKLATEIEVPCVTQTRDISAYAATHKLSTETAGRLVRLRCFAEVARAQGCTWIATGHQKDDNAETLIQRLRRGTGFRGLAVPDEGPAPVELHHVVFFDNRPFTAQNRIQ